MALVRLVSPFSAFRGKVMAAFGQSGVVAYDSTKGAQMARSYVVPTNPKTTAQVNIRALLAQASAGYKALTAAEGAAWTAAANAIKRTNPVGLEYELTGIGLYVQVNMYRLLAGLAISDTVPTALLPGVIVPPGALTNNGSAITVTPNVAGLATGALYMVSLSNPLPSEVRQARKTEYRIGSDSTAESFGSKAVPALTVTPGFFTLPTADARIGVKYTPLTADYVPGAPVYVSNTELSWNP